MRSLYWKIFISFWLATLLIIFTTAWFTSEIAQKSSQPAHEQMFMDSYANAAVVTYESGQKEALIKWLNRIGLSRHLSLYLISSNGEIIGEKSAPDRVKQIASHLMSDQLSQGIFTSENLIVSHEIISTSGTYYRLVAVGEKPISYFVQIPWAGLAIRLTLAALISGLICYWLSLYLTKPLRSLGLAAKSIATGKFSTRVGHLRGHKKDEIAALSDEFDSMAEQLEQLVSSKERLLQDISHELRSPLARLQIALALGYKKTNHMADAEFSRMELECERLNILIGEILEFARLDKSTTDLYKTMVSIPELLDEIIEDANFESPEQINHVQKAEMHTCTLNIDRRLIHRAIENVLRNALRYSPIDKPITVSLHYSELKDNVYIDIKDNGPGVPEEQLNKIFRPFYRVDPSREKKTGGYGLGLAIATRAVELHNGTIVAKNCDEGGLLVRIILPVK